MSGTGAAQMTEFVRGVEFDLRVTFHALRMANARAERWKQRTVSARAERDSAYARLAEVQRYANRCAIMRVEPSTGGLNEALADPGNMPEQDANENA